MTYPPPLTPVFPAGYGETPAGMNALIQYPLGFCATGIKFRAHQQSSQSLANGAWTVLNFDYTDEDPWNGWDTAGQPSNSWTPPASGTGWYEVTFSWSYVGSTLTYANSSIVVSGTRYVCGQNASWTASGGSYIVPLTGATDYVQMCAEVHAGSLNTNVSTASLQSTASISFIST